MSDARHTLRLDELRRGHSGSFGGKSSTLGELIAAGIPVPPGFAVPIIKPLPRTSPMVGWRSCMPVSTSIA